MNSFERPDDLERELGARPSLLPSAGFRQRVLTAMQAESQSPRVPVAVPSLWHFTGLTAAAVLLAVNFSMSVANDSVFDFDPESDHSVLQERVSLLRDLAPELSEKEATRQALLLHSGARLTPTPSLRPLVTHSFSEKELN